MTTTPASDLDFRAVTAGFLKKFVFWLPVIIGLIHQFRMTVLGVDGIYVVLNPPGHIYPFVTLEFNWWIILTMLTTALYMMTHYNRIRPRRLLGFFYLYLIFLLVWVKPI